MSLNKSFRKFVAKLIKYRILFKELLTFLELDFREASLLTLYFVVLKNSFPKIR